MLPLFFAENLEGNVVTVSGDEAHHAVTVTRIKAGEELNLADGNGNWVRGVVLATSKKGFDLQVSQRGSDTQTKPILTVLQALTKSDRVKETIELLVEGGVDEIIPWSAQRSISKWQSDSLAKWSDHILAACKQSRRFRKPTIAEAISADQLIIAPKTLLLVFHESASQKLSAAIPAGDYEEVIIVVGPEGGITEAELEIFVEKGAITVAMGTPVFRSAHAGVAALAAVQALLGKW